MKAHVEKLRADAAECALIRDLRLIRRSVRCSRGWQST
jgi:hypothetical protein